MDVTGGDASIITSTPGRLRLGIPALYRSQPLKEQLERKFAQHDAVIEVAASALTGRVLLLFRPAVAVQALLHELGIRTAPPPPAGRPRPMPRQPRHGAGTTGVSGTAGQPAWHLQSTGEALASLASSERGLDEPEARQRLRRGRNLVALPGRRTSLDILLSQFKGTPNVLLGVATVASMLTGALAEAAALGAVLLMNAAIGFRTERQAEATISSLSELVDETVLVLRAGRAERIKATHVVPGDVLVLRPGARIAADVRLLQARRLQVDESPLTGESFPVEKDVAALAGAVALAERANMAYRGTAVASGSGLGLVVATGSRTEVGAIEALARLAERPKTPIQVQLDQLGGQLVGVSSALCLGVLAVGLLRGQPAGALLRSAIALAIAAVPEGLPTVATTSLARGLRRLRERGVLLRHLHAVETIGTISTICLDKTGTLTMNQMSAIAVRTLGRAFDPADFHGAVPGDAALARLLQMCVLSNEGVANHDAPDSPIQGSATENALLELALRGGLQPGLLRERYPLLAGELRAERRNYMRTVHATPGRHRRLVAVKGNPAEVLAMCAEVQGGWQARACDALARAAILAQNDEMARDGLRVLGFACAEVPSDQARGAEPLTWLGLVGLADPIRPGMEDVVNRFHQAGIRTVMLTGDQPGTARQIGKALRLAGAGKLNVVDAAGLEQLAPEQLRDLAARADVFARVTPSDKLRIVKALQASGAIVAMTGDGINDSPALRAADVGIAMGSGTELALSVADIALKYDQLEALLDAVAQGRAIADNIRKSVHFLVSSNLSEILVVFGAVAFGSGAPLTPLQLLWLNLLTDILPAIALAEEAPEPDVMRRRPRAPREPLVHPRDMLAYTREAAWLAGGTLAAHAWGGLVNGSAARAATVGFDTMLLGQMLHARFCRAQHRGMHTPANPQLAAAIATSTGLQALAHLVPGLRRLLGLTALRPLDLLVMAVGAGLPWLLNEMATPAGQSSAATKARAERSTRRSTTARPSIPPAPVSSGRPPPA
jgi:Ca2+-transporting ATPase